VLGVRVAVTDGMERRREHDPRDAGVAGGAHHTQRPCTSRNDDLVLVVRDLQVHRRGHVQHEVAVGDGSRPPVIARQLCGHEGQCGALIRPQFEDDQRFTTTIGNVPDGAIAGIAAFADTSHYYALTLEQAADGGQVVALTKRIDDLTTRVELPAEAGPVQLVIDGHETAYSFGFRQGGVETDAGRGSARLLSAEVVQWFVGVHWMLLASGPTGGSVRFEDCSVAELEPTAPASPVPF